MEQLSIKNLGPIKDVRVDLGDLTLLVGAQASGKSIALETLKFAVDHDSILNTLDKYNYIIRGNAQNVLNVYYGDGMSSVWKPETRVVFNGETFEIAHILSRAASARDEALFYVPAQRILSISDGRPKNFMEFDGSSPYVLRLFSEKLRMLMQNGMGNADIMFPIKNRLKGFLKRSFNESIFHDATVMTEERAGQKKMVLKIDEMSIPFMSWSAGQKEFMPLLLAFYCLSGPPSKVVKKEEYKYVVIEEPEMGLHPQAIISIILQILELMQAGGYKVIVSTHSPVFLEFAWAFNLLRDVPAGQYAALYDIFHVKPGSPVGEMLRGLFDKSVKTYFFQREKADGKVVSHDISSLDVADVNNEVSEWGGLSEFASLVSDVVSKYVSDNA